MSAVRTVVCTALIAALCLLGVVPAAAAGPGDPVGALDSVVRVTTEPGYVFLVTGWAAGTTDGPGYGRIAVYVDGAGVVTTTGVDRPDVAAHLRLPAGSDDRFGYVAGVDVPPGSHRVCAYAIGGSNPLLGCRTVQVDVIAPSGNLDAVTAALEPGFVNVVGWARQTAAGEVAVYLDNVTDTRYLLSTTDTRVDGKPGFRGPVPVAPGRHRVCAYALGGLNPLLGCRMVDVPASANAVIDEATKVYDLHGNYELTFTGWAYDAAAPDRAGRFAVYKRTLFTPLTVGVFDTDLARPDVQAARALPQDAVGFSTTLAYRSGLDEICDVWIYQIVESGENPLFYHYSTDASLDLGSRTVHC